MIFLAAIGDPAPDTRTVTMTLRSLFSPWFWPLIVNVGGVAAGMRFTEPGASVVGPTLTETRPWPWVPGAAGPLVLEPPPWAPRRSPVVAGSSQPRSGRERLTGVVWPATSLATSFSLISGATRCDHSTSEARNACIWPEIWLTAAS